MAQQFVNNWSYQLASTLSTGATTMSMESGAGAALEAGGTISATDYAILTIDDGTNIEIVKCTGVSTDDLTVVREQESTTSPATFASNTPVECRITAGWLEAAGGSSTFPEAVYSLGTLTGTKTVDYANGRKQEGTPNGEAFTFSVSAAPTSADWYELQIYMEGPDTSDVITWSGTYIADWDGGTEFTGGTSVTGYVITLISPGGTTQWYGSAVEYSAP